MIALSPLSIARIFAAASARVIGRDLIAVKAALGHGNFLAWIKAEFGLSDRTARNFVHVADRFVAKTEMISDLAPAAFYALAAPSTPDELVEDVAERAADGETFGLCAIQSAHAAAPCGVNNLSLLLLGRSQAAKPKIVRCICETTGGGTAEFRHEQVSSWSECQHSNACSRACQRSVFPISFLPIRGHVWV